MKHFLIIITILSACICQAQTLPDALFAHIESSGTYTMLADKGNHLGLGEKVAISTDFYKARHAVSNQQWRQFLDATEGTATSYWADGKIPEGKEQHPFY